MFTTFLFEVELNLVNIFKHFISDLDECQMSTHNCSDNATCINTEGSFNCSCKPGYRGNGYNCSGWCSVANSFLSFSLYFLSTFYCKKNCKDVQVSLFSEFVRLLKTILTFYFRRRLMSNQLSQL